MKKMNRKGFTIVELVIVIAIVAVLAAVLIPTFSTIIKKANDSAYLQDRTNQQIADMAEKLATQNEQYLTWEDFEAKLAEQLAKQEGVSETEMQAAITNALAEYLKANQDQNTALTEDQVKAIVEKALEGQLTTAQVQAIVEVALNNSQINEDQVKSIVDAAVKELETTVGKTGITKQQMEAAIKDAIDNANLEGSVTADDLKNAITESMKAFVDTALSADDIKNIIDAALSNSETTADQMAVQEMMEVIEKTFTNSVPASLKEVVDALEAHGYDVNKLTPITSGNSFYWEIGTKKINLATTGDLSTDLYKDLCKDGASFINKEVSNASEALEALNAGNDVTLTADITLPDQVVTISGDVTINLNGYDLDASASTSRPFAMSNGSILTINASNSVVNCGLFGLVNITPNSDATLVINGGNYVAKTDNGSFIKVRPGGGDVNITLINVIYTDTSTNGGFILNTQDNNKNSFDGNMNLTIIGGEYSVNGGITCSKTNLSIDDTKITTKSASFEIGRGSNGEIKNSFITTSNAISNGTPAACVAISYGGSVTVTGCTLETIGDVYAIYSEDGTLTANNNTVTAGYENLTHIYNDATGKIVVDGVVTQK